MLYKYKKIIISILLLISVIVPAVILGSEEGVPYDPSDTFSGWSSIKGLEISGQDASPVVVAISLVNTALVFLGVLSTGVVMYAGIIWFFARDNEEQAQKALNILKGGLIGMFIIIMSYSISYMAYWIIASAQTQV